MVKGNKPKGPAEYALYRGDEFLDLGTVKYLAEKLNIQEGTIRLFATPSYRKKTEKSESPMIVIRIEDD